MISTTGLSMTQPLTLRVSANHYENQKPTSPPAARSAKTRYASATAYLDEAQTDQARKVA